jgi:hypothetical protein
MFRRTIHILLLTAYCATFPVLAVTHVHPFTQQDYARIARAPVHEHASAGTIHAACDICCRIATSIADCGDTGPAPVLLTCGLGISSPAAPALQSASHLCSDGRAPPPFSLL